MDDFLVSCNAAAEFPRNLVYHDTYEHNLTAYQDRLKKRDSQLFSADESANLELEEHDFQNHSTVPPGGNLRLIVDYSTANSQFRI
jgi:hypothetical protein